MSEPTAVLGTVVDAREYGPLVVLYVEAKEGQVSPVPMNRLDFDRQMGGDCCPVVRAVGCLIAVEGGSVVILSEAAMIPISKPKFGLGRLVSTPGALEALQESGQTPWFFLSRHVAGDWGDLSDEDRRLNDEAVREGTRLLSAYTTLKGRKVWVITEADRRVTTLLPPGEY